MIPERKYYPEVYVNYSLLMWKFGQSSDRTAGKRVSTDPSSGWRRKPQQILQDTESFTGPSGNTGGATFDAWALGIAICLQMMWRLMYFPVHLQASINQDGLTKQMLSLITGCFLNQLFLLFYVTGFLPACISVYRYVPGAHRGEKRALNLLELELLIAVSHHEGTRNQTQSPWKRIWGS